MSEKLHAYLYLHFCVLLWGFTAILGKLISLKALSLVWWRVGLCSAILILILPRTLFRGISRAVWIRMFFIGSLVGLHWLCFYGAVKLSNASVAVASMAMTSFFSAMAEPYFLKKKFQWYEMGLSLLILPGMGLILGNLDFSMWTGFAVGVVGAMLASLFSVLNKKLLDEGAAPSMAITFTELFAAFLLCSLFLPFAFVLLPEITLTPVGADWIWLIILAVVCTILPYYLSLQAMRHITAFAATLTINLEPVYGVLLAVLFFREDQELGSGFYLGVGIVLVAVFSHPFLKKKVEKKQALKTG
jgi:drug/metabolite transporter (DMT)-like permease